MHRLAGGAQTFGRGGGGLQEVLGGEQWKPKVVSAAGRELGEAAGEPETLTLSLRMVHAKCKRVDVERDVVERELLERPLRTERAAASTGRTGALTVLRLGNFDARVAHEQRARRAALERTRQVLRGAHL